MRPLRPSQTARYTYDGDDHEAQQAAKGPGTERPGPLTTGISTAIPGTKRATCSQCRVRKVRCDGRDGFCQNCDRLGFECSFQQSPSRSPARYGLKAPERRRRLRACIPCHLRKTRCQGELPACSNCVRRSRECTYPGGLPDAAVAPELAGAVANSDRSSASGTPSREAPAQQKPILAPRSQLPPPDGGVRAAEKVAGTSLPGITTALELIDGYFDYLYPLPSFAFLHKATVIRRCQDGALNESLGLAICAVTSLHLQHASLDHATWAQDAEKRILQKINRPSIFHLQALLLVIRYRIESGEFPNAFMLAGLAARMAVALRLNYERSELAFVAQEARRRLFWALYLLDDNFCVGLREFELCPEEIIHLQLPCREEIFETGQHCQTGLLRASASDDVVAMGLRGAFIRVTATRRAIMRLHRRVGLGEEAPWTIGGRIRQLEQELVSLRTALAPENQYSVSNLLSCDWPAQFVMLHVSYYQCHCDLYRMFLNGYSEAAPSVLLASIRSEDRFPMQARCLENAESIIQVLDDFLTHHTRLGRGRSYRLLLERDVAVCGFEAARLLMFGARLPCATSTFEAAIHKVHAVSLRLISDFFPHSASTQAIKTALEKLTASYTQRIAQQLVSVSISSHTAAHTPDTPIPTAATPMSREPLAVPDLIAPSSSTKISQYANSRQRLSVQSLLLQSDFADDSAEIAGPSSYHQQQSQQTTYPSTQQTINIPPVTYAPKALNMSMGMGMGMGTDAPIDALREDAGLIFNPWMGFSGTEDLYGLLGVEGLSEEY
ncbi:fungal-specific transcription factor domain-containing protein [Astrocystis sublimbata]|nr:fungal-specific transcription factor domain-containing protein [Astrocystis sublimbata]